MEVSVLELFISQAGPGLSPNKILSLVDRPGLKNELKFLLKFGSDKNAKT